MFHMANDSHLFRTQEWLEDAGYALEGNRFALADDLYLPLYEAKLFHQFDHRFSTFADLPRSQIEKGNARELSKFEKVDRDTVIIPRYWVHEREVALRTAPPSGGSSRREQSSAYGARLAHGASPEIILRDIARATDRRTGVATVIPVTSLGGNGKAIIVGTSSSATSPMPLTSVPELRR